MWLFKAHIFFSKKDVCRGNNHNNFINLVLSMTCLIWKFLLNCSVMFPGMMRWNSPGHQTWGCECIWQESIWCNVNSQKTNPKGIQILYICFSKLLNLKWYLSLTHSGVDWFWVLFMKVSLYILFQDVHFPCMTHLWAL